MCCFCPEQYPDPGDLKIHTLEHLNDEAINIKTFRTVMGVTEHSLCIKLDITALTCNLCNSKIGSLDDLYDHLPTHEIPIHTDIKNHIVPFKFDSEQMSCCICAKAFNSFKPLLEHMNAHSTNFVCAICSATFVNKAKISVHENTHAKSEFKCGFCPKVMDTKLKKACHENSAHKNANKISKCGYCFEKFGSYKKKARHLFDAHGIPLPNVEKAACGICARAYLTKDALKAHLRRVHLLEKRHKCAVCGMEFFALSELKNHAVKHTGGREFQCHLCLKAYMRKKSLTAHMQVHSDEKFNCDACGGVFAHRAAWQSHVKRKHNLSADSRAG